MEFEYLKRVGIGFLGIGVFSCAPEIGMGIEFPPAKDGMRVDHSYSHSKVQLSRTKYALEVVVVEILKNAGNKAFCIEN